MTEYIEKSAAIHAVLHNEGQAAVAAVQEIKGIEIVTCGECVHGLNSKKCGGAMFDENVYWCTHIGEYFTRDHFCADAVRKEQTDETD